MEDIKNSLIHYAEKSDAERDNGSPELFRTLSHPTLHSPLFDIKIETEHSWPSSNLLNGSGHYRAKYNNGAHLIMSDNRLLVVRDSGYFYCPPWDSPINDAYIQQQGPSEYSILMVALANGIYLALLHEKLPFEIVDDVFISTSRSVEKIYFIHDGEVVVCYANSDVENYKLIVEGNNKVGLISLRGQQPLRILQSISSLWGERLYRDSLYDNITRKLFVLSNTDLTVWTYTDKGIFTTLCSKTFKGINVPVSILSTSQIYRHITLVLANGGRQPVYLEEITPTLTGKTRTIINLGSIIPLPPDIRVGSIQYVCQDNKGTILLYDSQNFTVVMLTVNSPIYEGIYDTVEVVSTLRLSYTAVGFSCVSKLEDSCSMFVIYGKSGILCRISVPHIGFMIADMIRQEGLGDMTISSLRGLGPRRGMEAIASSIFEGASIEVLSPLLNDLMQPSFRGNNMYSAPGVYGILSIIRREIALAQGYWSSPFSWKLTYDLESIANHLKKWYETLDGMLRPHGWLDCPKPIDLVWKGLIATATQNFTLRIALNAQALLLKIILKSFQNAGILCWLYAMLLRSNLTTSTVSKKKLEMIIWGKDTDEIIILLCMEVLSSENSSILVQLEERKDILPLRARHAIIIHNYIAKNQSNEAILYACENIKSLKHEKILDYIIKKLEVTFPDCMPQLKLLLCWLKYDKSSIGDLLEILEINTNNQSLEKVKKILEIVMQSVIDNSILQHAVLHWMERHPLEDNRLITFAEIIEEYDIAIGEPRTLTSVFFLCWINRGRRPSVASRGFADISRNKQRIALTTRISCIKLALEYGPTIPEQLTYFILLLQEELADAIETAYRAENPQIDIQILKDAERDLDELRHFYVEERRLFELAGQYKSQGGAKIQLDLLKVHPETPEKVTIEVLHDLLEFIVNEGMSATDSVRNIVREYYDGYAAGLPILPFVTFLARYQEEAEKIAELLQSSGVPPYAIFDAFLFFFDERHENATFTKGALVTTLTSIVAKLSGESRGLCAAYLLERIRNFLADENRATKLQDDDIKHLQRAETMLKGSLSGSPHP